MRSAHREDFGSIPSATGGIARLAFARMREAGKGTAAVLSGAGLRAEQVDDPTVRLEVRTQIKILELAAQELQDDFLGFHLAHSFDLREIGLLYYVMASSGLLFVTQSAIVGSTMKGSVYTSVQIGPRLSRLTT